MRVSDIFTTLVVKSSLIKKNKIMSNLITFKRETTKEIITIDMASIWGSCNNVIVLRSTNYAKFLCVKVSEKEGSFHPIASNTCEYKTFIPIYSDEVFEGIRGLAEATETLIEDHKPLFLGDMVTLTEEGYIKYCFEQGITLEIVGIFDDFAVCKATEKYRQLVENKHIIK